MLSAGFSFFFLSSILLLRSRIQPISGSHSINSLSAFGSVLRGKEVCMTVSWLLLTEYFTLTLEYELAKTKKNLQSYL